jgi:hypothetical protein
LTAPGEVGDLDVVPNNLREARERARLKALVAARVGDDDNGGARGCGGGGKVGIGADSGEPDRDDGVYSGKPASPTWSECGARRSPSGRRAPLNSDWSI